MEKRILEYMNWENYRPLKASQLQHAMGVGAGKRREFTKALENLVAEGAVFISPRKKYGLPQHMGLKLGLVRGLRSGSAIIKLEPDQEKVFVAAERLNTALHNDTVWVRIYGGKFYNDLPEAEVAGIVMRGNDKMVGRLEMINENYGFVVPDDPRFQMDLFVRKEDMLDAEHGDRVHVEIVQWPTKTNSPRARVLEVLGRKGEFGVDRLAIIRQYELPDVFSKAALRDAEKAADREIVPDGREDFRSLFTVTIDGADAKDFDDAISLEVKEDSYVLYVHIADVSYYVAQGTNLDREAALRGNSVYFPGLVLPMLPEVLSNEVCSLKPGSERYCLTAVLSFDSNAWLSGFRLAPSLIKSDERLIYQEANAFLRGDSEGWNISSAAQSLLTEAVKLAEKLRELRSERGSINFIIPESHIIVDDESGQVLDVRAREHGPSEQLIEEFMLAANEAVAEYALHRHLPIIYRVHEEPNPEKLREFGMFLRTFNLSLPRGPVQPYMFRDLLEEAAAMPEQNLINNVALRSMQRARYSPYCEGHFGLAATYYCHFTAPIRRYSDLYTHRILKQCLAGKVFTNEDEAEKIDAIEDLTMHITETEWTAELAERDMSSLLKVEYMADKVGKIYSGLISGITHAGIFVALPNTIEGFISLSSLFDDYYKVDLPNYRLIGERHGRIYRLGDKIRVRVSTVDVEAARIEFVEER